LRCEKKGLWRRIQQPPPLPAGPTGRGSCSVMLFAKRCLAPRVQDTLCDSRKKAFGEGSSSPTSPRWGEVAVLDADASRTAGEGLLTPKVRPSPGLWTAFAVHKPPSPQRGEGSCSVMLPAKRVLHPKCPPTGGTSEFAGGAYAPSAAPVHPGRLHLSASGGSRRVREDLLERDFPIARLLAAHPSSPAERTLRRRRPFTRGDSI